MSRGVVFHALLEAPNVFLAVTIVNLQSRGLNEATYLLITRKMVMAGTKSPTNVYMVSV